MLPPKAAGGILSTLRLTFSRIHSPQPREPLIRPRFLSSPTISQSLHFGCADPWIHAWHHQLMDDAIFFSIARPLFFRISAIVTTVAIAWRGWGRRRGASSSWTPGSGSSCGNRRRWRGDCSRPPWSPPSGSPYSNRREGGDETLTLAVRKPFFRPPKGTILSINRTTTHRVRRWVSHRCGFGVSLPDASLLRWSYLPPARLPPISLLLIGVSAP